MKLLNFTIIKLTICLVIGILLAHFTKLSFQSILYITIGLVISAGIYWLILRSKINKSPLFGILACFCMIGIGMTSYNIQNETLRPQYYSNQNHLENQNVIIFQIEKRLKPDAYNDKYIVGIKSFNNKEATGHLLINVRRDSVANLFNVDDVLFTSAELKVIQKPLNPYQFDYSKYLELKQVYHQLYLNSDNILQLSDSKSTIYGYADQLRQTINTKLIEAGFKDEVLSIMNALLLI